MAEEVCEQGLKRKMDVSLQDVLFKLVIGVPFGLGAIFLFIKGTKRTNQFFLFNYQGNDKARFRDNLMSNLYLASGTACAIMAIFGFFADIQEIASFAVLLPIAICMGAFILPIGILGFYWQSFLTRRMYGGFLPTIRAIQGYDQPETNNPQQVDLSKVKLPKRIIFSAAAIALVVFFGLILLISGQKWNGPTWLGILLLIAIPGLFSFGIFMTITSVSLSRRIERMRHGELVDEE